MLALAESHEETKDPLADAQPPSQEAPGRFLRRASASVSHFPEDGCLSEHPELKAKTVTEKASFPLSFILPTNKPSLA